MNEVNGDEFECGCSIENLPLEVLDTLFSYLDEGAKRTGRLVTYSWKQVLDTYFLKFRASLNEENFEAILKSEVQFDTLLVRDLSRGISEEEEEKLRVKLYAKTVIFKQNSLLFYSEENPSVHPRNVFKIMQLNPRLEHLVFEKNTLTTLEFPGLKEICLSNLISLEVNISEDENIQEKTVLRSFLHLQMPNLSEICLNSKISSMNYSASDRQKFYFTVFEVLAKFKAKLKILKFFNSFGLVSPPALRIIRLNAPAPPPAPNWQLSSEEMSALRESLAEIQLKEFSFAFPKHEGYNVYTLGFQLLQAQSNLSKLEVNFNPLNQEMFSDHVEEAIVRCSEALQSFSIVNQGFSIMPASTIEGILGSLSNCSKLQSLSVSGFSFSSLRNICPTLVINSLQVNGRFDPCILLEIVMLFPRVESLAIFHNDTLDMNRHPELTTHLKTLVESMHNLEVLTWKMQKFDLNFLSDSNVRVVKVHQFIDYYSVHMNRK